MMPRHPSLVFFTFPEVWDPQGWVAMFTHSSHYVAAFQTDGLCFAVLWTLFKDLLILLKYRRAIKTPICLVENHFQLSKSLLAYWFTLYIKNLGKGETEQWC